MKQFMTNKFNLKSSRPEQGVRFTFLLSLTSHLPTSLKLKDFIKFDLVFNLKYLRSYKRHFYAVT